MKADFFIKEVTDRYILIEDLNHIYGNKTITNDAENVVKHISKSGILEGRLLFYIDTDGRVDRLQHNNGTFISFIPGYETIEEFNNVKDKL